MSRLKRANPAIVIAIVALCVAVVGTAAAGPIAEISLTKQEKKQTRKIAAKLARKIAARVSNKQITKRAPKLSVASAGSATNANAANVANSANTASVANTANSLAPSEGWHEVGAAGQPGFLNGWVNLGLFTETAAFYKDHEGIVHLRGYVKSGTGPVFTLPPGYRPATAKVIALAVACTGGSCSGGTGIAVVFGPGLGANENTVVAGGTEGTSLNGISFRAES